MSKPREFWIQTFTKDNRHYPHADRVFDFKPAGADDESRDTIHVIEHSAYDAQVLRADGNFYACERIKKKYSEAEAKLAIARNALEAVWDSNNCQGVAKALAKAVLDKLKGDEGGS